MGVGLWVLAQGDVEEGKAASELLEEGHWGMDDEDEAGDEGTDLAGEKPGEGPRHQSLTALIRRQLTHMVRPLPLWHASLRAFLSGLPWCLSLSFV